MNVILVPKSVGKGRHISLSQCQTLVIVLVLLVALPVLIGTVTFQIDSMLSGTGGSGDSAYLADQARQLAKQRREIDNARRDAEMHLDALAQRMGHMQAQLMRLNALGQRLTSMAGLDKREFDFSEDPPMGGPETDVSPSSLSVPDFMKSLDELSDQLDKKGQRLSALESVMMDRQLQAAVSPAGWPTRGGWISSGFGYRTDPFTGHPEFHEGIDIADSMGSPIYAMGAGVVSWAGPRDGYGNLVEINHGNGLSTRYGHASKVLVKVGDRVRKGQVIALVGSTGRSTGPHVHFEVLRDGHEVDPKPYLRSSS
ncbi:MAG: peptidoglycan DD-metalloendopeptidase family protein [Acidiferrobacterales bacterium]